MALRDYKKGKYLLENRPGQLLPMDSTKDANASKAAEQQQKRILDKVWASVEKSMGEMRNVLVTQLQDTTRSVDEQEKTLEFVHSCRPLVVPPSDVARLATGCFWNCSLLTSPFGCISTDITNTS